MLTRISHVFSQHHRMSLVSRGLMSLQLIIDVTLHTCSVHTDFERPRLQDKPSATSKGGPSSDKQDKWVKLRTECLPDPQPPPWLLVRTALSVYISVSASLHLDRPWRRRQPVSTCRHVRRHSEPATLCQKQSLSAEPVD